MIYSVKEIFYTLQGEGLRAGRPAVFCRFTGCNLWTGREQDRASAVCQFCDTDFVGTDGTLGGKFQDAQQLALQIAALWPQGHAHRYVVLTGGEPLLQVDDALITALHASPGQVTLLEASSRGSAGRAREKMATARSAYASRASGASVSMFSSFTKAREEVAKQRL